MDSRKIEVLAEHQEAMGNLYHIFSERSPDFIQFWSQLADDKFRHVISIHALLDSVKLGKVRLKRDRLHMEAIRASLQFVRRQISSARRQTGSFTHAFPVAVSIETTIIEKKFFEAFESDSPELRERACKLLDETKNHLERLQAESSLR
jgi:hypothetical protein